MYRAHKQQLQIEQKNGAWWIKTKQPGMWAFIARPCKGVGADRSVVLVGPDPRHNGRWWQAVKFWDKDHRDRAAAFVERYNRANPVKVKVMEAKSDECPASRIYSK